MTTLRSSLVAVLAVLASASLPGAAFAATPTVQTAAVNSSLTVTKGGSGSGTVTSNVGAIDCDPTCSDTYANGTPITLTATPAGGSQFTGWLGPCTGQGTCQFTINGATTAVATFASTAIGAPRLNIDGTSGCDALTDGLLILRHLFGLSGAALIDGAVGAGATRATATQVGDYLTDITPALDVDGNGQTDALTDGLLIIRYLFGLRGASLIAGAVGTGATRDTTSAIEMRIEGLCLPAIPILGNVGLDSDHAVTKNVGVSGGTLNTTDAHGASYSLVIPPFALKSLTPITMVPVQGVQNPPAGTSVAAGAHLLPEGLRLMVPAKLTIDLPSLPAGELVPLAYSGDLQQPQLYPAILSPQQIEFDIAHFSGYAAFVATTTAQIFGWFPAPSSEGDAALQAIVTARITLTGTARATAMVNALQSWLDNRIKPDTATFLEVAPYDLDLFFTGTPARLRSEMLGFSIAAKYVLLEGVAPADLGVILSDFRGAVRDAVKHAIETSNAGCSLFPNAAFTLIAPDILGWQELARITDAVSLDSSLARENVIANLCVQVAYDPNGGTDFPSGIAAGESGTLTVRAGYTINGGPVRFDLPMHITMGGAINVSPIGLFAFDVAAGASAQKTFQWLAGTSEMQISVEACPGDEYLWEVCQHAFVVRGGSIAFGCQQYSVRIGAQTVTSKEHAQLFVFETGNASASGSQGAVTSSNGISGQAKSVDFYRVVATSLPGAFQAVVRYRAIIQNRDEDQTIPITAKVALTWTGGTQEHTALGTFDRTFPITLRHNDVVRLEGRATTNPAMFIGGTASYSIFLDQLPAGVHLITAACP